jgi:hypothetical protein
MAFNFSLMVDLLQHRLLAAKRTIKNLPADYFVEKHKKELSLSNSEQSLATLPSFCHICGFSMAELILDNNWSIRACSATGLKNIINNPNLNIWQKSIRET